MDCIQGLIITKCCNDTVTSGCSISESLALIKTWQFYCYDKWLISKKSINSLPNGKTDIGNGDVDTYWNIIYENI